MMLTKIPFSFLSRFAGAAVLLTMQALLPSCATNDLFPKQSPVSESDDVSDSEPDGVEVGTTEQIDASATDVAPTTGEPPEAMLPDAGVVGEPSSDDPEPTAPQQDAGVGDASGALMLLSTVPANNATNVEPDVDVLLQFDRNIAAGAGTISVLDTLNEAVADTVDVTDADHVSIDGSLLTIRWAATLGTSTSYSVVIDSGAIVAEDGSEFVGLGTIGELSFSIRAPTPVLLEATNPSTGDVDVELDADIALVFSEGVVPGGQGAISIIDADTLESVQSVLIGDLTAVNVVGPLVSVDLPHNLAYSTVYYVSMDAGAVVSEQGAPFAGFDDASTLTFETVSAPAITLSGTTPANGAVGVDPATALVFTFSEAVVAGSGKIRVSPVSGTGDVVLDIRDPAVEFTEDTVVVGLQPPLEQDREYAVEIDATAIQSTVGGAFSGLAATDLTFTTALAPPDPLLLVSTDPTTGATNVPVDSDLVFTFNQDVRLGAGNISVYAEGVMEPLTVVPVGAPEVTLNGASVSIDLVPPLAGGSPHYVLVSAGSFESLAGASFAGLSDPDAFTFVSEETFRIVSQQPADGATDVEPGTHLTLTFSEDIDVNDGDIAIYRASDDALLERVPLVDAQRVDIADATLTINMNHLLDDDREYYVRLDAGAITSLDASATFEGITTKTAWNFRTMSVEPPGGVSSGLVLWLDADYDASLRKADGVRHWADRSGQNHDVAQPAAAERPGFVAAGIGGRGSVRFDGTDDWLVGDTGFDFTGLDGFVVWQSSQPQDGSQRRSLIVNGKNLELNYDHATSGARGAASSCIGGSSCTWFDTRFRPQPTANKATLWNFAFDPVTTSLSSSVNGGIPIYNSGPSSQPTGANDPISVGGNRDLCTSDNGCHFPGDIAEVILYSRRLSQAERLAIVAWLRDKWSLSLPQCGGDETLGANGYCYYYSASTVTWATARDTCVGRGDGWHLVTARTALDHSEATARFGDTDHVWLGSSDSEVPGTWRWLNDTLNFWTGLAATDGGEAVNSAYTHWRSGEPSGGSAESCGRYTLDADEGWTWADSKCESSLSYLCEGPGD